MTETEHPADDDRKGPQWLIDIAGMLRFFSRLPVPRLCPGDDPAQMPDFGRAARTMPLVGAIIAAPAALILVGLSATALPSLLVALVTLALLIRTTGAFHEDGLADVADGIGGGWAVADKLRIMRDSRIGTYGGAALLLSLMIRAVALAALLDRFGPLATAVTLVVFAGTSRTLSSWISHALPNVRDDGASTAFGRPERRAVVTASVLSLALMIAVGAVTSPAGALVALGLAILTTVFFGRFVRRALGGQTGDVLGATQQLSEIALLVGLLAVPVSV